MSKRKFCHFDIRRPKLVYTTSEKIRYNNLLEYKFFPEKRKIMAYRQAKDMSNMLKKMTYRNEINLDKDLAFVIQKVSYMEV